LPKSPVDKIIYGNKQGKINGASLQIGSEETIFIEWK